MLNGLIASFLRRVRGDEPASGSSWMSQYLPGTEEDWWRLPVKQRAEGSQKTSLILPWICVFFLSFCSYGAHGVAPGTVISNTAELDYFTAGSPHNQLSNTVTTIVSVSRTDAVIELSRYWPTNADAVLATVPETFYEDASGSLQSVGDVFTAGSSIPLDFSSPLGLAQSASLIGGEPVFIQIEDGDQNLDSGVVETVRVVVTSETGDTEIIILAETGPDTGVFIGVLQTSKTASAAGDGLLYVVGDSEITASYTDPVDSTDVTDGSLLVDPLGLVFGSCDGAPVNGAEVTLINADTNLPAQVLGDDGISTYPATVISGASATDGSGAEYDFPAGSYRFPLVTPGNYRLQIVSPEAFNFPSTVDDATLQALPGGPFTLSPASRGADFAVNPGPAVRIDVPLDCTGEGLLVTKTSERSVVGIGDFLPYEINVSNGGDSAIATAQVVDVLPVGFRYARGSARVNEVLIEDPQIDNAGSQLRFNLGSLAAGESLTLSYVVEVSAGAAIGEAVNRASATDGLGASSNIATARVRVRDDFFLNKTFISGRVFDETDSGESCTAGQHKNATGLENARVYLEDGTVVLTDKTGRFHFEGLEPGTHVVQLDTESLPANYEVVQCDDDTRSAGRAFSRFVDIQGGGLWRTDFYVRKTEPKPDMIRQVFDAQQVGDEGALSLTLSGEFLPLSNIRPMVILPEGITYQPRSAQIDSEAIDEPEVRGRVLIFNMGETSGQWKKHLSFSVNGHAEAPIKAMTAFVSEGKTYRLAPVELMPGSAALSESGELALSPLAPESKDGVEQETPISVDVYSGTWLAEASPELRWLYPGERDIPAIGSTTLVVQHAPDQKVTMLLNGEAVNPLNYYGAEVNKASGVAVSRWQGVDIQTGHNPFVAVISDASGREITRLERVVHFSDTPAKAQLVTDQSILVADGRETPIVAVQFFDRHGYPARPGTIGNFEISSPYESKERFDRLKRRSLAVENADRAKFEIGHNGVALIALQPTTRVGEVVLSFNLEDDYREEIRARLQAGQREWIVVGLAEGVVRERMSSGEERGLASKELENGGNNEGRVAFFAKGMIRGDWLLTAAYDTDKKTGNTLKQVIDPDTYYTLYGDDSYQQYEAASQRKLFLKLEKQNFYAMLGDFDSGLSDTELGAYNRTVNGIKTEYYGGRVGFNFFVTESEQGFVREEIRGDGTSGNYLLGHKDIVENSEKIVLETRDRLHSEQIVETQSLSRHIDYNIDYDEGSVYFRRPISSRDADLNPIYIVAEYETEGGTENNYTGGGRLTFNANEKLEIGATAIRENNSSIQGDLIAADLSWQLSDNTELRFEAASSEQKDSQTSETRDGNAYIAELEHRGQQVTNLSYIRQQGEEFGLGQQRSTEQGTRKIGNVFTWRMGEQFELQSDVFRQQT